MVGGVRVSEKVSQMHMTELSGTFEKASMATQLGGMVK